MLSIAITTALNMHVSIASDTAIARAFGIAVGVAPSITDELTNIVFVVWRRNLTKQDTRPRLQY